MPTPTKYTYSIAGDTANGKVNSTKLTSEIQSSSIVIALDRIDTSGDILDIWFKDPLSGGDQTTLTALVNAHIGGDNIVDSTIIYGYLTTINTITTAIRATDYVEQTTEAQRSLVSTSTDDTSAGIGARTVIITYYDGYLSNKHTETVTMNGTTPVNTVATNICYIEKIEVATVGANGSNAGTISLKAATGGGGATIGTIAIDDNQTNWCHHYIASSKVMYLTNMTASIKGVSNGRLLLRRVNPINSDKPDLAITPTIIIQHNTRMSQDFTDPVAISGPARVTLYGKAEGTSTVDWFGAFTYNEV
jgi:hypothetical protein